MNARDAPRRKDPLDPDDRHRTKPFAPALKEPHLLEKSSTPRPYCFDLEFRADAAGRSFVGSQFVRYPAHVCRGLYTDVALPGRCSVSLQSVSGGLFESDQVSGRIRAQGGARACVSTSASTIVHTMRQGWAEQSVELIAHAGAVLEYLPEPLILFPGSRLRSSTTVRAHPSAMVVFSESFLPHDPAAERRSFEALDARVRVLGADGKLLAADRLSLEGREWGSMRTGISERFRVHGGLWIVEGADGARRGDTGSRELLGLVRDTLGTGTSYAGASVLPNRAGLLVRILSDDATGLRRSMQSLLAALRAHLLGEERLQQCPRVA